MNCKSDKCKQGRAVCPSRQACGMVTRNGGNVINDGKPLSRREFEPDYGIEHSARLRWWVIFPIVRTAIAVGAFVIVFFLIVGLVAGHLVRA